MSMGSSVSSSFSATGSVDLTSSKVAASEMKEAVSKVASSGSTENGSLLGGREKGMARMVLDTAGVGEAGSSYETSPLARGLATCGQKGSPSTAEISLKPRKNETHERQTFSLVFVFVRLHGRLEPLRSRLHRAPLDEVDLPVSKHDVLLRL